MEGASEFISRTANASLGSTPVQSQKYMYQQSQIFSEPYHQYIGANNLETLLNAIELPPKVSQSLTQGNQQHEQQDHQKDEEDQHDEKQKQQAIHPHRLLPPPVPSSPPCAKAINDASGTILPPFSNAPTSPSGQVSLASILPSGPIYSPTTDSVPFPRLSSGGLPSPPNAGSFMQLPNLNQAIGDVDRNSPPPLVSSSKRKWDSTDGTPSAYNDESRIAKVRRSIDEYGIAQNPSPTSSSASPGASGHGQQHSGGARTSREGSPSASPQQQQQQRECSPGPYQMTTIICYHATVAQKSYGSEKRFLCPPPVVIIEPPGNHTFHTRPEVAMAVVCETGDRSVEYKTMLDENMRGTFKYLHVSGTAKAKQFTLKLKVFNQNSAVAYATFDSAPVTIISKPSKKTAKARNVSSCILSGSQVSLFNRINSQTVRTKYMGVESGQLCAKNSSWSSFVISLVNTGNDNNGANVAGQSAASASSKAKGQPASLSPAPSATPITYGSEVVLSDPMTGVKSERLVIRKVEKGRVAQGACGPVSQMQKVALQRVGTEGLEALYLSAAGPIMVDNPQTQTQCALGGSSPFLGYQPSRMVHMQNMDGVHASTHDKDTASYRMPQNVSRGKEAASAEEVDDYLCWTIVGIAKFQYTYYEAFSSSPDSPTSTASPDSTASS